MVNAILPIIHALIEYLACLQHVLGSVLLVHIYCLNIFISYYMREWMVP
jgi:hypothetical protein